MTLPYLPDWEWQLLNSDGTYLGSLESGTSRSVSWPLDGPATAQLTLVAKPAPHDTGPPLDALLVSELATDLLVSRVNPVSHVNQTLFRGRITASTETHSGDGDTLALSATDYRGMLDHRLIWDDVTLWYPNLDVAEIAWTLIQEMQIRYSPGPGYDLGITQGVGYPTGYAGSFTFTPGTTIGSAISQMGDAAEGGFDWDVDENLKFNVYHPTRGTDHGVDLVYGSTATTPPPTPVVAVTIGISPDGYANAIYMTGTKVTHAAKPVVTAPSGVGAWDQQKSDPNQAIQLALDDQAAGWLEQEAQIGYQTVQAVLPAGVWDPDTLWVGDTAHLTIDVGRLTASGLTKRVIQVDVALDDNGVEQVTLNLGQSPPKLSRRFGSIHGRISKLELEPKGHVLDSQTDVLLPANTWFLVTGYTPRAADQFYRAQVHINVPTTAEVGIRARFTDAHGTAQIMTVVPIQVMAAGMWFPHSVQFKALGSVTDPGYPITIEAYSNQADTTVSGQIESV